MKTPCRIVIGPELGTQTPRGQGGSGGNRVIFDSKGNDYRIVVRINYPYPTRFVYMRFVGTHTEQDAMDVEEV